MQIWFSRTLVTSGVSIVDLERFSESMNSKAHLDDRLNRVAILKLAFVVIFCAIASDDQVFAQALDLRDGTANIQPVVFDLKVASTHAPMAIMARRYRQFPIRARTSSLEVIKTSPFDRHLTRSWLWNLAPS
jgi:hypothetical protein